MPDAAPFQFVANDVCLDFVNTEVVQHGRRVDHLGGFGDFVAWLRHAGVLDPAAAAEAVARWGEAGIEPGAGAAAFADAVRLRTALRAMAGHLADGEAVSDDVLAAVNQTLAERPGYPQVARAGAAYVIYTRAVGAAACHLVALVAEAAASLLSRSDRAFVRRCEHPACVRYFVDTTKNKARRWCSMDACGSRQKSAAYYRRTRARDGQARDEQARDGGTGLRAGPTDASRDA